MVKDVFTYWDFISPIYLIVIIYLVAFLIVKAKYRQDKVLIKNFYLGLTLKLFASLFFVFIYGFYYKGGDTFNYFRHGRTLSSILFQNPKMYFEFITSYEVENVRQYNIKGPHHTFEAGTSFIVTRFASIFNLLSGNSYVGTSLLFAFASFLGLWAMYRVLCDMYPFAKKQIAFPILFFPSVVFWGSPILKDTIVIGFLGILLYSYYQVFYKRKRLVIYIPLLILSFFILKSVKQYVIIAFIGAMLVWIILGLANKASTIGKLLLRPILFVFLLSVLVLLAPQISKISQKFALDQVLERSQMTAEYIARTTSEDGSAYSLGDISYTPLGLLKVFPKAVIVTLYRPFLFEANNPIMLISAIESSIVIFFTIYTMFKIGIFRFFHEVFDDSFLLSCFVFSIFFAFAVGLSSFNFGALVRYKIPCLPFYGFPFIVVWAKLKSKREKYIKN